MSVAYDPKVRTTYTDDVPKLRAAHKVLLEVPFTPSLPDKGYTRRTLFIDLDTMTVKEKPITEEMIDIFTGGRGFGLHYLWHAITPQTKWNDPDNTLVISPGPVAGNPQYAGSGKSLVVTLSPMTGIPIDCNVGGYFGPFLKFCGFDALEIRGKAKNETIVVIDGPKGHDHDRRGAGRDDRQSHRRRALHAHVRRRPEGLRQRRRSCRPARPPSRPTWGASTSPGTTPSAARSA